MIREIIIASLTFAWKNKKLWLLGAIVSLAWHFEEFGLINRVTITDASQLDTIEFWSELIKTKLFTQEGILGAARLFQSDPISFFQALLFLLVLTAFFLFLLWLVVVSLGGLVSALGDERFQKNYNFKTLIHWGKKKFWRIFFLNIFIKALFSLFFFFFLIKILSESFLANLIIFFALFFLYLIFSVSFKYAVCGIMLKNWEFFEALKKTIPLVQKAFVSSMLLATTLGFISFLMMLSGVAAFLLLSIPFTSIAAAAFLLQYPFAIISIILLYGAALAFSYFILRGCITVFAWRAWVQMFQKIS